VSSGPHVGDVGTVLKYQCLKQDGNVLDVSTASTIQITFVRPDKSRLTVNASLVTNGQDGWVQYVTQSASDLSLTGIYTWQVYVSWGATPSWHSDKGTFQVWPNE